MSIHRCSAWWWYPAFEIGPEQQVTSVHLVMQHPCRLYVVMVMQADVQLIVDVLDEAYIAMDKGPIDDTHALIVTVEHYPNTVTLQEKALQEVHTLMSALERAYASKGLQLVGFERYQPSLRQHHRSLPSCSLTFHDLHHAGILPSALEEGTTAI